MKRLLGWSSVRYLLVGGLLFLLDLSVFMTLVKGAGWAIPAAQLVSRTVGATAGFALHRSWTFAGEGDHALSLPVQSTGYVALTVLNILISPLVVTMTAMALPFSLVLAKVVAEAIVVVESYLITRWLFTRREA